jgi:signal transduction histidine kinase
VGNVLNSVNAASHCMEVSLKRSRTGSLSKVVGLLREHETDLGEFLTTDPKGKQVPAYLAKLADHLIGEQSTALKELAQLQENIEHIKEVVSSQQRDAKGADQRERALPTDLVEDTLRMEAGGPEHRDIQVVKEFEAAPAITVEKHKVLQILMNLVRNGKQACHEAGGADKRLTLRVTHGDSLVRIAVSDNGVGISPENLARIFTHGFTTKKDGHGFGLHSAVAAAKEMGGSLTVHSDGPGTGATFTLELPVTASV